LPVRFFAGGLFVFNKGIISIKNKKAMRTTKQNISDQVDGKIICFDDYNFDFGYLYVFFDPSTDELCAGCGFNTGISRDYSINYNFDFSIDENLDALYNHIIECNML
jgi:hypothetical protein